LAKEWSWSYSKLKNYRVCPKRHYEVDVQKNFTEDSEQLTWGNSVHKSLAAAVLHAKGIQSTGSGRDKVTAAPLPDTMVAYQKWVDVVAASPGTLYVEQKYAITRTFQKTGWFAADVWYRGIADLLSLYQDTATALDWKTGKVAHESEQLMLMASCIFVHHPEINTVKTRFMWLKEDCTTRDEFHRADIMKDWTPLLPELAGMEKAYQTLTFPPKPNAYCRRWCPVTSCPYHGKDNR
jgi:hypothetical protein